MANVVIDDLNIYFENKGNKGKNVILLHGWGQNTVMMDYIASFLCNYFRVYNIDLPGFGKSDEPKEAWSVENYTDFLKKFSDEFKIENPILIGHSFGCRIALLYAYKYGAYKMVLTGAAGVKPKRGLDWYIRTYTYKIGKIVLKPFKGLREKLAKNAGSEDYKNASPIMKGTLVKNVNFDITPYLKDIKAETLLVFGDKDEATPMYQAKTLEKNMPNAALVIFEGDDHFAYFHQGDRFNRVLDAFLKVDYND